ncbi:terminase small subunit [Paraburkholderia tropica]|uniref:Phage terminase small subunit n=1 Tax=Paraburkholderia tropica TaxID=92647 RepID=A0ABX5MLG1_9BURK|nr:terminase small subunit [Paraburkholderia tropica]PXX14502.1 phage terminase small subunit [Paraburkholderia tropica]PZW79567.1 phage terminase small subunit [Paraburkholderia tropica]
MALTAKKRLFADAVLAGKSNRDAAIAAGYSEKTASQSGARLVKDKDVALYVAAQRIESESKAAPPKSAAPDRSPPPDFDPYAMTSFTDPKAFLIAAMNDGRTEPKLRVDAAKALMPFVHAKVGEAGKKDAKGAAAEKAANKFAALAAPKLIVNNRK